MAGIAALQKQGVVASEMQHLTLRAISTSQAESPDFVSQWDRLAHQAIEPNSFYESWFLLPSLRNFPQQVRIWTFWDHNELVALMPLSRQHRYGRWPMPYWQNWLHHNMFLGTPLVVPGYEELFWQHLLHQFDGAPGSGLFLHLNAVVRDGPVMQALKNTEIHGRRIAQVQKQERAFLQSDLAAEDYYERNMRSKKRKELRRQKNRLSEMGELTFHRDETSTDTVGWAQEFITLEQKGWKGQNGSALGCSDATSHFFKEAIAGAAASGKLELLDLRLDGKPIAMLVNFMAATGSFSFKTAFDEKYSRYSPGVLLQIENLALLEREGLEWCDSCAAEGHPMIDSIWSERRQVGRYSIAIGGKVRRALFESYLNMELARMRKRDRAENGSAV